MKAEIESWLSSKGYGFNGEAFCILEKTTRPLISELVEECMGDIGPKWVSVSDRLPDEREFNVLILNSEGIEIAQYHDAEGDGPDYIGHDAGWYGTYAFPSRKFGNPEYMVEAQGQPTHWMLIPSGPSQ